MVLKMLRHLARPEEPDKQQPDNERPLELDHGVSPIIACNYDDVVGESKPCGSRNEPIKRNEVPLMPHGDKRTLQKFIEGDEILDQKNPFKSDDTVFDELVPTAPNNVCTTSDEELDFITKEEILRQSKYVKTYVKNPDKQLNYDKSVIEQMDAIRATGHQVKDVIVLSPARPPIPAPRKINCPSIVESKIGTYNEKIRSLPRGNIAKTQQTTVKPIPMMRRDYCDLKVRVGSADLEESLYDSNEVVQNALKFDSRFRTVEFGSQDDIDTIAEKTDIGSIVPDTSLQSDIFTDSIPSSTPSKPIQAATSNPNESHCPTKRKESNFAEEVKKSFSNTIKSADFRKYLQSRGLTLIPTRQKQKYDENGVSLERSTSISTTPIATKQRQPTKLSVLSKFLQSNIFEPKSGHSRPMVQGSSASLLNPKKPKNSSVNGGDNKSSHIGRSYSMSAKPKASCRQLEYRNTHDAKGDNNGQFATMDFNRTTRLRTSFAGRSSQPSLDTTCRRSMRNAGIQVNLEITKNAPADLPAHLVDNSSSRDTPVRQKITPQKEALQRYLPVELKYSKMDPKSPVHENGLKGSTASSHTVVPVYSEPLRYGDPINYHIYEQTPDNLRREMLYGHIGYIHGSSQLSGWHPQNRRSFSSVQEAPTYGRLRSAYVSLPISTQSTPVRRTSETLDRQQILHKIYDFYRRSIRSNKLQNLKANDTEPALYNRAAVSSGHRIGRSEEQPRFSNMEEGRVIEVVQVRGPPSMTLKEQVDAPPQQTQYDRNIENIYSFVTKKMNQLRVHEANEHRVGSIGNIRNSTRLPRRVMFLNSSYSHGGNSTAQPLHHGIGGEADYVNIRGPPDGIQYRPSHC